MNNPEKNLDVYLVGGAVRDQLLGLEIKDRDWVVVGSTPKQMVELGFTPVGKDFPVFLHPHSKEEYALARTERKTARGYLGFETCSDPSITLQQDLLRRDLTINAIAQDSNCRLIDPYGGIQDVERRRLRHVSSAFTEDPVRILRLARFACRFQSFGFAVDAQTLDLMRDMVDHGEADALVAERIWLEIHTALAMQKPSVFIQTLRDCGALARILPEVDALFGIPQPEKYHPEIDTGIHVMMCLDIAAGSGGQEELAFAALLHDLGKALTPPTQWPSHRGHESSGLPLVNRLCDRLRVPARFRKLALQVCEYHLHLHRVFELKPATILRLLDALDAFRQNSNVENFARVCESDWCGRAGMEQDSYPQAKYLKTCCSTAGKVNPDADVIAGGNGRKIRQSLQRRRIATITEVKRIYQPACLE